MDHHGPLRRRRLLWRAGWPPLRVRLATAAAGLLAAGAVIIVLAGAAATRGQLTRQAGQELRGYALQLARHPFLLTPFSQDSPEPAGLTGPAGSAVGPLSIEVRGAGGRVVLRAGSAHLVRAGRPGAAAGVLASRDRPGPVRALSGGSFLSIAQPIRYRAHRIPYAYTAQDFAVDVTSPGGTGSPGTLVLNLSLGPITGGAGRLTVILLAVSGLLVAAAAAAAAWTIRALLRPLSMPGLRAAAIAAGRPGPGRSGTGGSGTGATVQMAAAVARAGQDLRKPLGVLDGLTEYYRHRGQVRPGDFERLLARAADETARISTIIDALAGRHPDQRMTPDRPGPSGRAGNVGGSA